MTDYFFKGLLALSTFVLTQTSVAQVPQKMSYQAVIRNASNVAIINTIVGMRINILQGSAAGTPVYVETQTPMSNAVGLVTIEIGSGTVVSGTFVGINWSTGLYWIKTETDPLGGTAYSITGNSQLLSVPYALFAGSSSSNGWGLNGNYGTVNGTHFIGTTDNIPLTFKVNNSQAGRIDHIKFNTFFGYRAGPSNTTGFDNTAIGSGALQSNSTGYYNTAIGKNALFSNIAGSYTTAIGYDAMANAYNTPDPSFQNHNVALGFEALKGSPTPANNTGNYNTAIGNQVLSSNTTGEQNTATGRTALVSNTTGSKNTANGKGALINNTSGSENTAIGTEALMDNISGVQNTGIGLSALRQNTIGIQNSAIGSNSLSQNTIGNKNVAIGWNSFIQNTTGNQNTAIGSQADVASGNLTNATAIGNGAIVDASNKVRIGNTAVTIIEGQVAYSFPSDARFKYNIQSNVPGLAFIIKLKPFTYLFDEKKLSNYTKTGQLDNNTYSFMTTAYSEPNKIVHTGFLAQDIEKICKELGYEFDGLHKPANDKDHYSLAYSQFIMPLVKGMQEQQLQIEEQKQLNKQQHEKLQLLQKQIEELKQIVEKLK